MVVQSFINAPCVYQDDTTKAPYSGCQTPRDYSWAQNPRAPDGPTVRKTRKSRTVQTSKSPYCGSRRVHGRSRTTEGPGKDAAVPALHSPAVPPVVQVASQDPGWRSGLGPCVPLPEHRGWVRVSHHGASGAPVHLCVVPLDFVPTRAAGGGR